MDVDWAKFHDVFEGNTVQSSPNKPSANKTDTVKYNGEKMPRWLAGDVMRECAAILEYDAGLTRAEAEAVVRRGLGKKPPVSTSR